MPDDKPEQDKFAENVIERLDAKIYAVGRQPKRKRPPSRPQRWTNAVADALQAKTDMEGALQELMDLQSEYQEWRDNLPDNLQNGTLAEKLDAVCELDLEGLQSAFDVLDEAEQIDLPRGFGKD